MKNRIVKYLSVLLTAILLISTLASCTQSTITTSSSSVTTSTKTTTTTTIPISSTVTSTGTTTTTTPVTTTVLTVVNGTKTQTYTLAQLMTLQSTEGYGATKNKGGAITGPDTYVGVTLTSLIKAAGGLTNGGAVRVTAQDSYSKTLTYAQVYQGTFNVYDQNGNSTTAGTQPFVSLIYSKDGSNLDATAGPVEMGIITDYNQASDASMWIKLTNKIEIIQPVTLNISAASSLANVLKAIDTAYTQANPNVTISLNTGSSGTLRTQIENGAPADVFLSADAANMDSLQKEGLINNNTRKNLLNNTLVMIVPNNSTLVLTNFSDLTLTK